VPDSPFYEWRTSGDRERRQRGQPRDRDARACYVVVHRRREALERAPRAWRGGAELLVEQVEFVRVEYDLERTVQKILAEPNLEDLLGTRLYDGR